MAAHPLTLEQINRLSRDTFVERLGFVFEHSPWVAAAAWDARPFASRAALHAAMCNAMWSATPEQQLALICAHPDLAGKAAIANELTDESTREQASAGLNRLTPAEFARFTALNNAYRMRFDFPFIICVREHTKASILASFEQRIAHTRDAELHTALGEIAKIAGLRLADAVTE